MLGNAAFGADNKLALVGFFCKLHDSRGGADIIRPFDHRRHTFGVDEKQGFGITPAGFLNIPDAYGGVDGAAALQQTYLFFGNLFLDKIAEVAVGYKQYFIIRDVFHNLDRG